MATATNLIDTLALGPAPAGAGPGQAQAAPGALAPAEKPQPDQAQPGPDFGQHNEKLPEQLRMQLYMLVQQFSAENRWARRQEVRAARQARFFWRGFQYLWWSEKDQNWHLPTEQRPFAGQEGLADMPRFQYVTNIYQAFGLSVMSPLTQNVPRVRFLPTSAEDPDDVATAKAATKIIELIERNTQVQRLLEDEAYFAWTDGKLGAYIRYVADGQRFGFEDQPELAEGSAMLAPPTLSCPCGFQAPASKFAPTNGSGQLQVPCPNCARMLTQEDVQPEQVAQVPQVAGVQKLPKGQEVISIVGALELKTPILARDIHEMHYLTHNTEHHFSKLRAMYPWIADKIHGGSPGLGEDTFERIARISVAQGTAFRTQTGDAFYNMVTLNRTWMRPYVFEMVEDKAIRQQLYQLFPDGCYVAFAGDAYAESRNESMDDHWVVMHALPGDGQNRPSMGEAVIPIQERFNDLTNLMMETYEYGIPITWADQEAVDIEGLQEQIAEPGSVQPIHLKAGQSAGEAFFTPAPAVVSADMLRHTMDLMGPIAQFVTGAFPSLFGGNMEDQKTASAYAMARDQAMGRLGIVWRRMRQFHADTMRLAVGCFQKNRAEDVELPLIGAGKEFKAEWIRLGDLKGNFTAHPEGDENFPTLWTQQRGVYMELLKMAGNPQIAALLADPDNMELGKRLLGLTELDVPAEGPRDKQRREIEQLLAGQPVDVDPDFDNHGVELEVATDWMNSDAGQSAKQDNPQGYMAVRRHALQHKQFVQQLQAQQGPEKPPSESMNFKDLPPEGQVQMAKQAGIKIAPPVPLGAPPPMAAAGEAT
jgi:hypothetical protein